MGLDAFEFFLFDRILGPSLEERRFDIKKLASVIKDSGIVLSDFLLNVGGIVGGSLNNPQDRSSYIKRLRTMVSVAHKLDCQKLITTTGNCIDGVSREKQHENIVSILKEASKITEKEGITLILEPLNTRVDHRGYYLDSPIEGAQIVEEVNSPSIKLLFDCYHMQIMNGNLMATIDSMIDSIGHFHLAGVPGRNEIFIGELNYQNIIRYIESLGYKGYIGLEYRPTMPSEESIKKTLAYLRAK